MFSALPHEIASVASGEAANQIEFTARLLRRLTRQRVELRPLIDNMEALLEYLGLTLSCDPHEQVRVLFTDHWGRLILDEVHSRGSPVASSVSQVGVLKRAIQLGSDGFFLVHNHPSGDPRPSPRDQKLTHQLRSAAATIGLQMHDHLIVGRSSSYSCRQERHMHLSPEGRSDHV